MEKSVDTSGFELKSRRVKTAFAAAAARVLLEAAQDIYMRADKNLKGPHYGVQTTAGGMQVPKTGAQTGKMPIPRVTGTLARSLKLTPLSTMTVAVWADPHVADYAKYVHDGTKHMKPRRFIGDVVQERKSALQNMMRQKLLEAIRAEGQK